ncbi:MAG: hypothetical protein E7440_00485 [Ruminococcaceae bacterium]|nr:hypothetical protein [Oscillospiraceae bacterium]
MKKGKIILQRALHIGIYILLAGTILLGFFTALRNMDTGRTQEGQRQLEQAVRRAAAAYYAEQGVYPPTLEELTRYSGVQIDEAHYRVFYEAFADNLMPDITVLVKSK